MILITADLHLNDLPRDAYRHRFLRWFREQARQRKASCVIVLGDLCEEKDRHPAALVNTIVEHFYQLSAICPVIILRGNHDYLDPSSPFYAFLNRIDGVVWVNEPKTGSELPEFVSNALRPLDCLFLPHTNNYQRDWKGLDFKKPDWVFAHQTFKGADVGFGHQLDGIPLDYFPDGSNIISGDIHVPQRLLGGRTYSEVEVNYVGAPCLVDFGDNYEPSIILLDGSKFSRGQPNLRGRRTWLKYPGPQKRLYECSSIKELERAKFIEGDIVKVKFKVSSLVNWAEQKAAVKQLCLSRGVQLYSTVPVLPPRAKASKTAVQTQARTDGQTFADYCKAHGVGKDLEKVGNELMEKR